MYMALIFHGTLKMTDIEYFLIELPSTEDSLWLMKHPKSGKLLFGEFKENAFRIHSWPCYTEIYCLNRSEKWGLTDENIRALKAHYMCKGICKQTMALRKDGEEM